MNYKDFNLEIIKDEVSTQYGDYAGLIQIDGHSGADLFKLCSDNGIDMENNFLLSFGMGESTINGIGQRGTVSCRAVVIEKGKYGNSFDEIKKKIIEQNGKVNAVRHYFQISYKELTKYIKRFDFIVVTKLSRFIDELNVVDEI